MASETKIVDDSSDSAVVDVFDAGHYAATPWERIVRSMQLGPKYYLGDIPRYLVHRRKMGLSVWDTRALLNPLWEFVRSADLRPVLPPGYLEALGRLKHAGVRLTMPRRRLEPLLGCWWACRSVPGDVIECGSYRGATGLLLAALGQMNGLAQKVLLLDTFEGMPATTRFDVGRRVGEFAPPGDQVALLREQANALGLGGQVEIHKGLFAETFKILTERDLHFAFVHIDANIYEGTLQACEFTIPRVPPGGRIVFDDYNGVCDLGARLAIDAALKPAGLRPRMLAGSSAYIEMR
jgi:hypothetical protein